MALRKSAAGRGRSVKVRKDLQDMSPVCQAPGFLQLPLMMTSPSLPGWMIRHMGAEGLRLERKYAVLIRDEQRLGRLVSYAGNKEVPLLRLYRYKEAFAFRLVEELIARFGIGHPEDCVLDPFCGMGTTLLAAALRGIPAIGIDRLPVAVFIAQTLPLFFQIQPGEIMTTYGKLKRMLPGVPPAEIAEDVGIMKVAFPENTLQALRRWKAAIEALEPPLREIYRLLFFAILEPCSYTAKDGQFLRMRRSKKLASPDDALLARVMEAEKDVLRIRALRWEIRDPSLWTAILGDARNLHSISFPRAPTALITSPPYANRYDYTRIYSLELCFHFVRDFSELRALRRSLLRSHIETRLDPSEKAPHPAVQETVDFLKEQKASLNNPRIPEMLTAYFVDMRKAIQEWSRVLVPGARAAIVVDNVRFAGRLLPVDLILCEMSEEEGFQVEEILVARYKGNSSQQMRQYGRIPARESILIWRKKP